MRISKENTDTLKELVDRYGYFRIINKVLSIAYTSQLEKKEYLDEIEAVLWKVINKNNIIVFTIPDEKNCVKCGMVCKNNEYFDNDYRPLCGQCFELMEGAI